MGNKLNIILLVAAILFAAAFGYLLNQVLNKPEVISYPVLIPGKDSVIVYNHYYYKSVFDSLKAEVKNDTARTETNIQQIFELDTLRAKTNVEYYLCDSTFNIAQSFDFVRAKTIRIDTLKIPYETIKEKDVSWFEQPYFNFIAGIFVSILIFFLSGG